MNLDLIQKHTPPKEEIIKLSILIMGVPSRVDDSARMIECLSRQAEGKPVEVLALIDNKHRTVGAKANDLVSLAKGEWIVFADDDDWVMPNYVSEILKALESNPDLVSFKISCHLSWANGTEQHGTVWPDVNDENEEFHDGEVKRKPLRLAVWRTSIARQAKFPDIQYGEDSAWASQLWGKIKAQVKIDKFLYEYIWSEALTEAK